MNTSYLESIVESFINEEIHISKLVHAPRTPRQQKRADAKGKVLTTIFGKARVSTEGRPVSSVMADLRRQLAALKAT